MQMFFSELVFVIGQFFTSNIDNDNKLSSEVNLFVVTTKPAFFAVKQTFIHEAQRAREESNYRPIICEKKVNTRASEARAMRVSVGLTMIVKHHDWRESSRGRL